MDEEEEEYEQDEAPVMYEAWPYMSLHFSAHLKHFLWGEFCGVLVTKRCLDKG